MKIKSIRLVRFKRFTNLLIDDIPETAKLIVLVGPNGSGKTSIFEGFNHYYRLKGFSNVGKEDYFVKKNTEPIVGNWYDRVKIEFHGNVFGGDTTLKGKFYFRTAYRNEADFTVDTLKNQSDPTANAKFETLNGNDITVSENYQRLVSQTLAGVFMSANNLKTVEQYREELIGEIRSSLKNVFDDLTLSSIGDPLSNGSFYFEKGEAKDFHYKNLSAGEKSVFDILLDIIIKSKYYANAVFCIDEPEAHMHTRLQAKFLSELYRLIPSTSQLWISTHSIGMLRQAEELELKNPGSVIFLNFDNKDFDNNELIRPSKIDRSVWDRFFELALADFSKLIAPKQIVFCEGTPQGRKYKNFDAQIYSKIFGVRYYDTTFVSIGSCNEIEDSSNPSVNVVVDILKHSKVIKFVDRDSKSAEETDELLKKGIKTLLKRHLENYLLDDEIITKLCTQTGHEDKVEECLNIKKKAIQDSVSRGNPSDDIKSASGQIITDIKKVLNINQGGNNTSSFLRDTMAPLITEDTKVFEDLEKQIFS